MRLQQVLEDCIAQFVIMTYVDIGVVTEKCKIQHCFRKKAGFLLSHTISWDIFQPSILAIDQKSVLV